MAEGSPPEAESGGATAPVMQLIYANTAGMRGGPFDMSLEFGYVVPKMENEDPVPPTWLVRIAMSYEHARAFHELLGQQLDSYEDAVGKLPSIERLKVGGDDNG